MSKLRAFFKKVLARYYRRMMDHYNDMWLMSCLEKGEDHEDSIRCIRLYDKYLMKHMKIVEG